MAKLAIDEMRNRITNSEPIPEIIFLDLNMPLMDGWQFLSEFIKLPITKVIRINIVTSSIDIADIEQWKDFTKKDPSYNYL